MIQEFGDIKIGKEGRYLLSVDFSGEGLATDPQPLLALLHCLGVVEETPHFVVDFTFPFFEKTDRVKAGLILKFAFSQWFAVGPLMPLFIVIRLDVTAASIIAPALKCTMQRRFTKHLKRLAKWRAVDLSCAVENIT